MSRTINTTATVRLTVTVDLHQGWSGGCAVEQVWDQARKEAAQAVTRAMSNCVGIHVKGVEVRSIDATMTEVKT